VDNDILMFERVYRGQVVLIAVNRGEAKTVSLNGGLGIAPGEYTGLLTEASDANTGNYLSVAKGRWSLHLNKLSSLVVRP
jgi:hypothetical protein